MKNHYYYLSVKFLPNGLLSQRPFLREQHTLSGIYETQAFKEKAIFKTLSFLVGP